MIDSTATIERNDLFKSSPKGGGVTRSYGHLRLRLDRPQRVLAGQFAMLKAHGICEPLLRRAMAYYRVEHQSDHTVVEFIYQILGRGTGALSILKPGDKVDHLGPLGNTYDLDAANGKTAILVAGGVGSAAVYMLAQELIERNLPTRLVIGGASRDDLLGLRDFVELLGRENVTSATVDGSEGAQGFVTGPLEALLREHHAEPAMIFACGPDVMLHRVGAIAGDFGIDAQLSLEAPMACGIGICVGCAVAVRADVPESFVYKKVCTDGPIFLNSELYWAAE